MTHTTAALDPLRVQITNHFEQNARILHDATKIATKASLAVETLHHRLALLEQASREEHHDVPSRNPSLIKDVWKNEILALVRQEIDTKFVEIKVSAAEEFVTSVHIKDLKWIIEPNVGHECIDVGNHE